MQETQLKKLMELPSDWWRLSGITSRLSEWFSQYVVGLVIDAEYSGRVSHNILSGFLVSFEDLLLWTTAGHIIDNLKKELSNPNVMIKRLRWFDRFSVPGAESVPICSGLEAFSSAEIGLDRADFGFIRISGIEEISLRKNSKVHFFTAQELYSPDKSNPEGFYLLGFPDELLRISDESQDQPAIWINLQSIPVSKIEPRESSRGRFWDDPDAFYGQLLPFSDKEGDQPGNIEGMSGGPIISVERDPTSGIRYRLVGIQRGWLKQERIIRGELLCRIFH